MGEWLASKVVFPLYERLAGRRFWTDYVELRELQWRPREELIDRSLAKLRSLMDHTSRHVPYYEGLFSQAGVTAKDMKDLSDLSRVPITGKADLRKDFPDRVTARNLGADRRRKGSTSGSTGLPLQFYWDLGNMDIVRTSLLFFTSWAGVGPWVSRIMIANAPHFYSHWQSGGRLEVAVRWMLIGDRIVFLAGYDLTLEEYINHAKHFQRWGPHYIFSFPSYGTRLASQIIETKSELPAYPRVFISTGETLTRLDKQLIEQGFQCKVINSYASLEVPFLAQSCPENPDCLHVNSERALVRVVRDDGSDAAPGELGRIIITDLANYVMPFINYDTGDWGVAGTTCSCGRGLPTLERVDGRSSEFIQTPNGRVLSSATLGPLLATVWQTFAQIWEYQLLQPAIDRVTLRVVPGAGYTAGFEKKLKRDLEEFLGDGMRVEVERVDRIEVEPSGKRLIIKSHLVAS